MYKKWALISTLFLFLLSSFSKAMETAIPVSVHPSLVYLVTIKPQLLDNPGIQTRFLYEPHGLIPFFAQHALPLTFAKAVQNNTHLLQYPSIQKRILTLQASIKEGQSIDKDSDANIHKYADIVKSILSLRTLSGFGSSSTMKMLIVSPKDKHTDVSTDTTRYRTLNPNPWPTTTVKSYKYFLDQQPDELWGKIPLFYQRDNHNRIVKDATNTPVIDIAHPGNIVALYNIAHNKPAHFARSITHLKDMQLRSYIQDAVLTLKKEVDTHQLPESLSTHDKNIIDTLAESCKERKHKVTTMLFNAGINYTHLLAHYDTIEKQQAQIAIDTFINQVAQTSSLSQEQTAFIATTAAMALDLVRNDKIDHAHATLEFSKNFLFSLTKLQTLTVLCQHIAKILPKTSQALLYSQIAQLTWDLGFILGRIASYTYDLGIDFSKWKEASSTLYDTISLGLNSLSHTSAEGWGAIISTIIDYYNPYASRKALGKLASTVQNTIVDSKVSQILKSTKEFTKDKQAELLQMGVKAEELIVLHAAHCVSQFNQSATHIKNHVEHFYSQVKKLPWDPHISPKQAQKRINNICTAFECNKHRAELLEKCKANSQHFSKPYALPILPGLTTKPLNLVFKPDHYLLPDIKIDKKTGKVCKIDGCHIDYLGKIEELGNREKIGRIIVEKQNIAIKGCERVIFEFDGYRSPIKDLFPKDWTWEKCSDKIFEGLNNIVLKHSEIGKSGYLLLYGKTSEDILIKYVIDLSTGKVKTCYPDTELMLKLSKEIVI